MAGLITLRDVSHVMQPPFAGAITLHYFTPEGEFREEVRIRLVEVGCEPRDVELHSVWCPERGRWMAASFQADFKVMVKKLIREYATQRHCDPVFPWLPNAPDVAVWAD